MFKKKIVTIALIVLFSAALVGAAVTTYYGFLSQRTDYTKKVIYRFDFSTSFNSVSLGPGDTVTIRPYVTSDASIPICVFIKVDMPFVNGSPLYGMNVSSDWKLVEQSEGTLVYAYVDGDIMYPLDPGIATNPLATNMTMKSISVADFAVIDDINATFTAYTMEYNNDTPSVPSDAWSMMKTLAGL